MNVHCQLLNIWGKSDKNLRGKIYFSLILMSKSDERYKTNYIKLFDLVSGVSRIIV